MIGFHSTERWSVTVALASKSLGVYTHFYPAVATNWNVKLTVVSFNSKRHYPLMFSLFSFARCVF